MTCRIRATEPDTETVLRLSDAVMGTELDWASRLELARVAERDERLH